MKLLPIIIFLLAIGCPSSSVSENSDNECKVDLFNSDVRSRSFSLFPKSMNE